MQFNEEPSMRPQGAQSSKIVRFVQSHSGGLIQTDKSAEMVLLVGAVCMLCLALFIFINSSKPGPTLSREIINSPQPTESLKLKR